MDERGCVNAAVPFLALLVWLLYELTRPKKED